TRSSFRSFTCQLLHLYLHPFPTRRSSDLALKAESDWDKLWLSEIPAASVVLPHFEQALGSGLETTACQNAHYVDTATDWESFKRSEEHTSELQSQSNIVCRLLPENTNYTS